MVLIPNALLSLFCILLLLHSLLALLLSLLLSLPWSGNILRTACIMVVVAANVTLVFTHIIQHCHCCFFLEGTPSEIRVFFAISAIPVVLAIIAIAVSLATRVHAQ